GGRRGRDDPRVRAAAAGRAVAVAADHPAMGPNLDLQDGGILGAADGGERAAAAPAATLVARDLPLLQDGGQVGVVAAARPRPAALVAAGAARRGRVTGGRRGRGWGRGGL